MRVVYTVKCGWVGADGLGSQIRVVDGKRVGYRDAEAGAEVDSSGLNSDLRCEDAIYIYAISVGGECSSLAAAVQAGEG